jgi:diguanylate cyclase (GGDEF)-like protein
MLRRRAKTILHRVGRAKEPRVSEFIESTTGVFGETTFRNLLTREASRATRYQDFFSVCLLKPDLECSAAVADVERTVTRKIAQFLRSTDMIGRVDDRIAILLLHTEGADAVRVAERLRAHIEQVAFPGAGPNASGHVTLSVGGVSFPRDGYSDSVLLSRAQAHLTEASRRGGNQVVYASEPRG